VKEGRPVDVDLRKLRYFLAVAELLSFGRAAERLHIAQPALSRQILALEKDLDAILFERDRHHVSLTAAGRQLLAEAPPLLTSAAAMRRRVAAAARGTRSLKVGFRPGIVVTAAVRAFRAEHPDTEVDLHRIDWDEQEESVLDGRVDIAFVRPPVVAEGLTLIPLYQEPRVALMSADHRLAGKFSVAVSDLAAEQLLPAHGIAQGIAPPLRSATRLRTVEEKLEHVAAGSGVLFVALSMARYYQRDDVVTVSLTDAPPDDVLLARAAGHSSALVDSFIRVALAESSGTPDQTRTFGADGR
jgi:DNA-binding transcriptional LysR family regulator